MADPLPLPKPRRTFFERSDESGVWTAQDVGYYTADQMRAYAAAARKAALLEAAELCDEHAMQQGTVGRVLALQGFATALRERANESRR